VAAAWSGRLRIVALWSVAAIASAQAQGVSADSDASVPDTGASSVSGRVVRPGERAMVGVPDVWVTLHRVGQDTAGPIDSMRTDSRGRYAFHYRRTGSADAVYFCAAIFRGVAYLSRPLLAGLTTGADAEIEVFDTTSGPLALHVQGRHVVIGAATADGHRTVQEVYELSNDSSVALVSSDDARPTWSAPIPALASGVRAGQGDVSPAALHAEAGRVVSVAAFAPGLKQLSFSYDLPATAFPLSLGVDRVTSVLEVLVEDSLARVSGAGLREVAPAAVGGRTFLRFLGHDAPAGSAVTVAVPLARRQPTIPPVLAPIIAVVAGLVLVIALALTDRRRKAGVPALAAERLARRIAALDEAFEAAPSPSESDASAYRATRATMASELSAALDGRDRAG